jgi:hypothetical protein
MGHIRTMHSGLITDNGTTTEAGLNARRLGSTALPALVT